MNLERITLNPDVYLETKDIRQALSYAACRSQEIDFPLPTVYNRELDEALERINSGEYLTQEEVEEQSKNW